MTKVLSLLMCFQIQVRHMATGTGDGDGIGTTEEGLYSRMWVITSELSGMGKTRYVKKFAETNHVSDVASIQLALIVASYYKCRSWN